MKPFDPYDPSFLTDGVPFDQLAEMRATCPVSKTANGAWYLALRPLAEAALKDVEVFRADLGPITGLPGFEAIPDDELFLSELMEPRHGQVRRIYNACFGPHRVREAEPMVRSVCSGLLAPLVGAGEVDLSGFASGIPGQVIASMMELPADAPALFMQWSAEGTLMTRPTTPGGSPIHDWFLGLVREQRPNPTNHIFKLLLEASIEGAPLTDIEVATHLHFMVMAGVHTTRGLLTHVVERLALSPELFESLREDRALVPVYVEESLRHDAPVQRTTRRVMQPVVVDGVAIEPGEWVEVGVASANRDEAVYEDPESFRLDRPEPRDHLAFGAGSHVCPGATLARLEAVAAVEAMLDAVASISLVPGAAYPPLPGNLAHAPIPVVLNARS